jgi:hypothetical protein
MVDIIIVNWNSGEYLQKCVQSLFQGNNEKFIHNIFIIDNNSSDLSLKNIERNDKIHIIINKQNIGFSRACNQGFRMCSTDYILLLNPDVKIFQNTISECILFMNQRNDIDILGCQLLNDENKVSFSCSRFPSPAGIFRDSTGFSKIAPSIFKPGIIMSDWKHTESRFVDQVIGAFMFMRKSILQKVGYFDERFFVYFEEVDFAKRLSLIGGKSFFNAEIKAIHSGEGTTSSVKAFRLFLNLTSRLQYAKKHFSWLGYSCVWFCTFFIEPLTRSIFLLFSGKKNEIPNLYKGYKLILKNKS